MTNQTILYGKAINLKENTFSKSGYKFIGWSTNQNATVATYTDKQSVTNLTEESVITLYAIWKEIPCVVSYGIGIEQGDMIKCGSEEFYLIKQDGTNSILLSKYGLDLTTSMQSTTPGTVAMTDITTYNTNYFNNLKNRGLDPISVRNMGDYLSSNGIDCNKVGLNWTCSGNVSWATNMNYWLSTNPGDGAVAMSGGKPETQYHFTNLSDERFAVRPVIIISNSDINYAQEYTITYNLEGGSGSFASQKALNNVPRRLRAGIPTKEGYIFKGWGLTTNNVNYASGANITVTGNTELHAIWFEKIKCNVASGTGTQLGDMIKCGTEEFYFVKQDGSNSVLLAKNGLNLTTSLQSETPGTTTIYNVYTYNSNYYNSLKDMGIEPNSVRGMGDYVSTIGCSKSGLSWSCSGSPSWAGSFSYWLSGNPGDGAVAMTWGTPKTQYSFNLSTTTFAVRPVVVLPNSYIIYE